MPHDEGPTWTVKADVPCHVRKRGEKRWRKHRTAGASRFGSYLWRNQGWYGFASGEWEMKVARRHVQETATDPGWLPLGEPLTAQPIRVHGIDLDGVESRLWQEAQRGGKLVLPHWLPLSSRLEEAWRLSRRAEGLAAPTTREPVPWDADSTARAA